MNVGDQNGLTDKTTLHPMEESCQTVSKDKIRPTGHTRRTRRRAVRVSYDMLKDDELVDDF